MLVHHRRLSELRVGLVGWPRAKKDSKGSGPRVLNLVLELSL